MRALGDVLAGAPAARTMSHGRRYRRDARFVMRPQDHYRPLDRNARARLIHLAERIERATKAKGKRSGFLGLSGLAVLRALMFGCLGKDGRLDPSYAHLQRLTGFARATIAKALRALEALGLLCIIRRIVRRRIARLSPITGEPEMITATVQASSLYVLQIPSARLIPLPAWPRPKPSSLSGQEPHQRVFETGREGQGSRQRSGMVEILHHLGGRQSKISGLG
jgi:hypothetical protein